MRKLKQGVYSKGYNSFDHPIELKEDEAQVFQNLYPRKGIATQREGTSYLNNARTNVVLSPEIISAEEQGMCIFDCVATRYWVHFFEGYLTYYNDDNNVRLLTYPGAGAYKSFIVVDDHLIVVTDVGRFVVYPKDANGRPNKSNQDSLDILGIDIEREQSYWFIKDEYNGYFQPWVPSVNGGQRQNSSSSYYFDGFEDTNDSGSDTSREDTSRMWAYYLITYVRRTDSDAMDSNGGSLETTVFSNGLVEISADFEKDTRLIYKRKSPVYEGAVVFPLSGGAGNKGKYLENDGKVYLITDDTAYDLSLYDPDVSVGTSGLVEVSYSDELPDDGKVNVSIAYPKASVMSYSVGDKLIDETTGTPIDSMIAKGYTHVRIYRTLFAPTQAEAKGSSLRFLIDRPISNTDNTFHYDQTTDAEMVGSLNTYTKFASQSLPLGKLSYVNGRLWSCPSLISKEDGRAYYSDGVYSPIDLLANLWHSQTSTNWVTIDNNGIDSITAVASENEDLVLFGQNSVWYIQGSDPSLIGPAKASSDLGIVGHKAWSSSEYGLFYLSKRGPALFANKQVRVLTDYKAGELYPKQGSFSLNDGNNTTEVDWSGCTSYLTHTAWMLHNRVGDKEYHVGYMLNSDGAFTIKYHDSLRIKSLCSSKDREVFGTISNELIGSEERSIYPLRLFNPSVSLDVGSPFTCIARSKDYFGSYDRNGIPERAHATDMFKVTFFNRFTGVGDLTIRAYLDNNVVENVYGFDFETDPSHDFSNGLVMNTECIFKEGSMANRFSIEWERVSVGKTDILGFDLSYNVYKNTSPSYSVMGSSVLNLLPTSPSQGVMVIEGGNIGGYQIG